VTWLVKARKTPPRMDALWRETLAAYERMGIKLYPGIEQALLQAMKSTSMARIAAAFEAGNWALVEGAVDWQTLAAALGQEMGPGLRSAMEEGGRLALTRMPGTVSMGWQVIDPLVVNYLNSHLPTLIREVTDETRAAVRLATRLAYENGLGTQAAARAIRSSIGLTQMQARAVTSFRQGVIEAADRDLGVDYLHERWAMSRDVVRRNAQVTLANANRLADAYQQRAITQRALTIARTEATRAVTAGRSAFWTQAMREGALNPEYHEIMWLASPSERTCDICMRLHKTTVPVGQSFPEGDPPIHPSCLPGEAVVAPRGRIVGATKRWFHGDLIILRCADALPLSCTPNHPVLTRHGWVPAGSVNVGDEIAHPGFSQGVGDGDGQDVDAPARIEDIAEAFLHAGEVSAEKVKVAAPDFHGDGIEGQVAIVGTYRELLDGIEPVGLEHAHSVEFQGRNVREGALLPEGDAALMQESLGLASDSIVGGGHLEVALGGGPVAPLQQLSLTTPPGLNAEGEQALADGPPVDVEVLGDLQLGPLHVAVELRDYRFGQVLLQSHRHFSGWVYNLETTSSYYIADGYATHNCRCDTRIVDTRKTRSAAGQRTDARIRQIEEERAARENARRGAAARGTTAPAGLREALASLPDEPATFRAFHATAGEEFDVFDPARFGTGTDPGYLGRGAYLSTDPNIAGKGQKTLAFDVTLKNPLRLAADKWGMDKEALVRGALDLTPTATARDVTAALHRAGYDSVMLDYSRLGYHHQEIMVPNPEAARRVKP